MDDIKINTIIREVTIGQPNAGGVVIDGVTDVRIINSGRQGPAGNTIEVQDEGITLSTKPIRMNFVGDTITASAVAPDEIEVTVSGVGVHAIGGADHTADTLANLNTKISDATLDDIGDPRDADNLLSATTTIDIASAATPSSGQVLTATGPTARSAVTTSTCWPGPPTSWS